jgi:hypothetical protein
VDGNGSCSSNNRSVVAVRRPKGVIIVVAKQLLFLEPLLETVGRKRRFA